MYQAYVRRTDDAIEAFILGPHGQYWEASVWARRMRCDSRRFDTGAQAIRWSYEQGATRITIVGIPPRRGGGPALPPPGCA